MIARTLFLINSDGFNDDEMKLPVMMIKEQSFAAAATRACKSIVDGILKSECCYL